MHIDRNAPRIRREWKGSYDVGVPDIDAQHRKLLDLINDISDMDYMATPSRTQCFSSLNAMVKYAEDHFALEQAYLRKYDYPEYERQEREHDDFIESVFDLMQKLETEGVSALGPVRIFLQDWFIDHVLGSDHEYKNFLAKKLAEEQEKTGAEQEGPSEKN